MTATLEHNRSLFGASLEAKLARLQDLTPADSAARRAVLRRVKPLAFRAGHRSSHLVILNGRVELGSRQPGYFKLLALPSERLAEIYAAWIVTGSTNGP